MRLPRPTLPLLLRAALPCVLGLAAPPASALMVEVPFDRMARDADAIVVGRVVALESSRIENPRLIVTDVTLALEEVWAGGLTPGRTLILRVLGGRVGDVTLEVEHEPTFQVGEQAVLFLKETPGARLAVQENEQGKYRLAGDQALRFDGRPLPVRQVRAAVRQLRGEGQR